VREVHEDVERAAAVALGLREDVGERVLLRIEINNLELVDDPVAAREDSGSCANDVLLRDELGPEIDRAFFCMRAKRGGEEFVAAHGLVRRDAAETAVELTRALGEE